MGPDALHTRPVRIVKAGLLEHRKKLRRHLPGGGFDLVLHGIAQGRQHDDLAIADKCNARTGSGACLLVYGCLLHRHGGGRVGHT
jgi:hypothetical protein